MGKVEAGHERAVAARQKQATAVAHGADDYVAGNRLNSVALSPRFRLASGQDYRANSAANQGVAVTLAWKTHPEIVRPSCANW